MIEAEARKVMVILDPPIGGILLTTKSIALHRILRRLAGQKVKIFGYTANLPSVLWFWPSDSKTEYCAPWENFKLNISITEFSPSPPIPTRLSKDLKIHPALGKFAGYQAKIIGLVHCRPVVFLFQAGTTQEKLWGASSYFEV